MALTNEAKQEVLRFLHAGQRLHAIKYLCDTFRLSLAESKMLIEAVQHELENTVTTNPLRASASGLRGDVCMAVQQRLRKGNKIDAVKYVKHHEKVSLKQALILVEKIEQELGPSRTHSRSARGTPYLPGIFSAAGIVLLLTGFTIYYVKQKTIANSERITGKVIALREHRNGYAPVIQYTWQGNEVTYNDNVYSNPAAYDVNDVVWLFVNRHDPSDVLIDSFLGRWLAICIVGGLGAFFLLFGYLFGFLSRKF